MASYPLNELLRGLLAVDEAGTVFYTDTIALTVFVLAIVPRLLFGRTGVFGTLDAEARGRGRFKPSSGERG